jgi:hypothetical protein
MDSIKSTLKDLTGTVSSLTDLVREMQRAFYDMQKFQTENVSQMQQQLQDMQWQLLHQGRRNSHRQHRNFPRPKPSPDTPRNSAYMARCDELDEAHRNNVSLATKGAKCMFVEHVGDLCSAPQDVKVHAIAADARCSRGVAATVIKRAGGHPDYEPGSKGIGEIIVQQTEQIGTIAHLITKELSPDKYHKNPEAFISNVEKAFTALAAFVKVNGLSEIAMSYLCTGMDRLHRLWAMETLYRAFVDVPVTIHFFNLYQSKRWEGIGKLFEPRPDAPALAPQEAEASKQSTTPNRAITPGTAAATPVTPVTAAATPTTPETTDSAPIPAETTPKKPTSATTTAPIPVPRKTTSKRPASTPQDQSSTDDEESATEMLEDGKESHSPGTNADDDGFTLAKSKGKRKQANKKNKKGGSNF